MELPYRFVYQGLDTLAQKTWGVLFCLMLMKRRSEGGEHYMSNTTPTVAVVVPGGVLNPHQASRELILLNPDGTTASTVKKQAAPVDTVAVDLTAMKVDFNALLAKLRAAGVIS